MMRRIGAAVVLFHSPAKLYQAPETYGWQMIANDGAPSSVAQLFV